MEIDRGAEDPLEGRLEIRKDDGLTLELANQVTIVVTDGLDVAEAEEGKGASAMRRKKMA